MNRILSRCKKNTSLPLGFMALAGLLFFVTFLHAGEQEKVSLATLTAQEQEWLKAHHRDVRIAHAPDWPPMDFTDAEGNHRGMIADYIRLIENKLGITFSVTKVTKWEDVLTLAQNHEIDVISAGQETQERREYMNWSTPYLTLETTIIVEKNHEGVLDLDKMKGMKIGVPKGYAIGEFIRGQYPYLNVVDVATSSAGMNKVSFGEIDAMVTEVPNALYIIEKEKITNLRLAGVTGFKLNHSVGIRNDWPLFTQIMEKALNDISEDEHKAIQEKWVRLETIRIYQTKLFWNIFLGGVAGAILLIGFVLLWNRTLKKQVFERTEELRLNEIGLEALLELNEKTYNSVGEVIEFAFHQMLRLTSSSFGYLAFDDQEGLLYIVDSSELTKGPKFATQLLTHGLDRETIGFWGEAVRRGKPLVSNNYKLSNPGQRGVPEKYPLISRYMNVPIINRGDVVVVAGVGNKTNNYTPTDLRQLNLLTQGMWRLIQRMKADQTIKKSEQRFRDLVENLPNGIVLIQDGEVVYENSKQMELMGELKLFGDSWVKAIHRDDKEKTDKFIIDIHEGTSGQREIDFRYFLPSGGEDLGDMKWVNCFTSPIEFKDKDAQLLITIDMTEAKDLERMLLVQDKMASLGHVSAGIAHEIRNPLSGININLRTIEKNFENPEKREKVEKSIEAVQSASGKIESVIRRVMNFAKPTEPKFKLIDINGPVSEALDLTRVTLNKKGIGLERIFPDNLPYCYAEPHLIEEVILNLMNNSAEALDGLGNEKLMRMKTWLQGNDIALSIEDNGPGIPRDIREKIFEPFFTTKQNSTGIGLSLCHRILTDHNGVLKVSRSELGGAYFEMLIPIAPKDH